MIAMRVIMIARVIFGLRRYVHSPLIVKGYSVNRLPVFLSPLSPPPHPSASRGRGRWGWGYSLREQHHLPLPFPALPLMARCTGRATGTPEGKVGGYSLRYQHHGFRWHDDRVAGFQLKILFRAVAQDDIVIAGLDLLVTMAILTEPKHHELVARRHWGEPSGDRDPLEQGGLALERVFPRLGHFPQHEDGIAVNLLHQNGYRRVFLIFLQLG